MHIEFESASKYGKETEMRKVVIGFPNYEVDEFGNVYNKDGLRLKQALSNKGYLTVSLSNNTVKHKMFLVHRLVAQAFIENPKMLPQVNHKDEDKTNNFVGNLEWCTPLENLQYSGVIEKASVAKFSKIRCVDNGIIYNSIKEVCDEFSLHHSNIVACCNNRRKTCGGMKWEYV